MAEGSACFSPYVSVSLAGSAVPGLLPDRMGLFLDKLPEKLKAGDGYCREAAGNGAGKETYGEGIYPCLPEPGGKKPYAGWLFWSKADLSHCFGG